MTSVPSIRPVLSVTYTFYRVRRIAFRPLKHTQAVMLTELWWGIASYGKWGTSTDRSCAGGGFAACLPSSIRQLGWSFIGSMSGINSVNLYTQV